MIGSMGFEVVGVDPAWFDMGHGEARRKCDIAGRREGRKVAVRRWKF